MWNLDQLKHAVTHMNEYADRETHWVNALEKDLAALGVGLNAHVEYKGRTDADRLVIAYARSGPKWRICVAKNNDMRPWTDWDRLTKVLTFPLLPDLITALTDEAEKFITTYCAAPRSGSSTAGTSAASASTATSPAPAG